MSFETRLSGGHPNSLGNTVDVVEEILADKRKLAELYACYSSPNEVVRLRTSNAFKRIMKEQPDWLTDYLDKFLSEVSELEQASAQWTLAQLFAGLERFMSAEQLDRAKAVVKRNLETSDDWIVLNNSMQTLADWAKADADLKSWLEPHLHRLATDPRKSVSGRAKKLLESS